MKKLVIAVFAVVLSSSISAQNYVGVGYTNVDIDGDTVDGWGINYLGIAAGEQVIMGVSGDFLSYEGIDINTQQTSIGYALKPLSEGSVYFDVFYARAQTSMRYVEDFSEFGASVGYGQMGGDGNEWMVSISTLDGETSAGGNIRFPIQENFGISLNLGFGSDTTTMGVSASFRF